MEDPQPPTATRWQWTGARGAKWRMPLPPGPLPEPSKAQRAEQARAAALGARLHLRGMVSGGVIVMGVVLAVVVVMFVLVLVSHH